MKIKKSLKFSIPISLLLLSTITFYFNSTGTGAQGGGCAQGKIATQNPPLESYQEGIAEVVMQEYQILLNDFFTSYFNELPEGNVGEADNGNDLFYVPVTATGDDIFYNSSGQIIPGLRDHLVELNNVLDFAVDQVGQGNLTKKGNFGDDAESMGGGEVSIKDTLVYNVRKNCLQYSAPSMYDAFFVQWPASSMKSNFDNGMEDVCDESGNAGNHNLLKMDVRNVSVDSRYLFQQVLHQYAIDQHGTSNQDLLDSLSGGVLDLALNLINLAQPYSIIHNKHNCKNIVFNNMQEIQSISDGLLLYFNNDPYRLSALANAACDVRPVPRSRDQAQVCNRILPIREILAPSVSVIDCAEITIAHLVGTFGYSELDPYYIIHDTEYFQEFPNAPELPTRAGREPVDYIKYNHDYINSYGPIDYPALENYDGLAPHYTVHRVLDISNEGLTNWGDLRTGLRYLAQTERLDLSDNNFRGGVPGGTWEIFSTMKALRRIDLSGNKLINWKGNYHGPDNLTALDLRNNEIKEFGFSLSLYPDGVENVVNLDLRGNPITSTPMENNITVMVKNFRNRFPKLENIWISGDLLDSERIRILEERASAIEGLNLIIE